MVTNVKESCVEAKQDDILFSVCDSKWQCEHDSEEDLCGGENGRTCIRTQKY
jgi:hypothetical protein